MCQFTSFAFIRGHPRHPRFFSVLSQIDNLRATQSDRRLAQLPQLEGKIDEFPPPTARKSLGRLAGIVGTAM